MALVLTNTLSGEKEIFQPLNAHEVRMYTCGPTVYDYAHIGNFRAYIFEDLLRRVLRHRGYHVIQAMNLTDVDDKTIRCAREREVTLSAYTMTYIKAFYKDAEALRIQRAEHYPRATQHVGDMIHLIERLMNKGLAYERDGSVYYRVKSFEGYGQLSKKDLAGNVGGARIDQDEYEKEEICDFALWKKAEEGEPSWEAPFGKGRPGWHIECSAMSMKLLGDTFDIHTGGEDNIFPHHENEIAQSEGATGAPLAVYWLHCRFLLVNGEKMSKSKGNFYTVRDLLDAGHDPLALRYLLISHHYGQPLNFTLDSLAAAEKTVRRINEFRTRFLKAPTHSPGLVDFTESTMNAREQFHEGLCDDLNSPKALSHFFDWMNEANRIMDQGELRADAKKEGEGLLEDFQNIFDVYDKRELVIPERVRQLVARREEARKARNFKQADHLREAIQEAGFVVEDTPEGAYVKRK